MFTQCPHCLTLFRITSEQLKAAEGQVRCCQCNKIFNALETLQEAPIPFTNREETSEEREISEEKLSDERINYNPPQVDDHDSGLINDSEVERSLDVLADDSSPLPPFSEDSNLEVEEPSLSVDNQSHYLYELNDGLETEPDYFASSSESQMSELLDKDSASLLLDSEAPDPSLAEIIELDIPEPQYSHDAPSDDLSDDTNEAEFDTSPDSDDLTEKDLPSSMEDKESVPLEEPIDEKTPLIVDHQAEENPFEKPVNQATPFIFDGQDEERPIEEPDNEEMPFIIDDQDEEHPVDEEKPFTFEDQDEEKKPKGSMLIWTIGSLLLLIPLCGQMAWQYRDNLIYHKSGRQLLGIVCRAAGCTIPLRIDTSKILVTERSLAAHPEKENILSMRFEMVNTAPFQQPFPKLQLSLFNDMGTLIARRTFSKPEYYPTPQNSNRMMPKLKPIQIELELIDPGKEVTGFKFEFL